MRTTLFLAALGLAVLPSPAARAQPFFNGGASAFDPQIDVVNSGVLLDAQATVSADRKYVTLTMRPQNATLLALRDFTFQRGQDLGFVGMPPPVQANQANNAANRNRRPAPAAPPARPTVLDQPGTTRVDAPRR